MIILLLATKDYHVYVTRSTYYCAYAHQTQIKREKETQKTNKTEKETKGKGKNIYIKNTGGTKTNYKNNKKRTQANVNIKLVIRIDPRN